MPIPTTQKFARPSEDEDKYLAQLERYTQQVSLAVNSASSYDYVSTENATGSSYLFLDRPLPVYSQSINLTILNGTYSFRLSLQSPNQGIVFLGFSGSIKASNLSYPIPFNDGTNRFTFTVDSSGNIAINATTLFVGGVLSMNVLYVYTY